MLTRLRTRVFDRDAAHYRLVNGSLPPRLRLAIEFYRRHRRWPDFDRPRSFSEKVNARQLHDRDPRLPRFVDKVAVKEIVAETLGPDWVVPTLWAGSDPDEIPFDRLEPPYVVKANHGSCMTAFVESRAELDAEAVRALARGWLGRDYGAEWCEWAYSPVPRKILVEPMLRDAAGEVPEDYKIFVFGGRAAWIQVDAGRFHDHRRAFYDTHWRLQSFGVEYPAMSRPMPRPQRLEEMLAAAERLGALFDFARVDFYEVEGRLLFGEITFYPGAGRDRFDPPEVDEAFGRLWPSREDADAAARVAAT